MCERECVYECECGCVSVGVCVCAQCYGIETVPVSVRTSAILSAKCLRKNAVSLFGKTLCGYMW